MHVSIRVRDAFADALRPAIAAVNGRVFAGRIDPFGSDEVPAIVVGVPTTQPRTDGLGAGRPGLQMRSLLVPVSIVMTARSDVEAQLYELCAQIEETIGNTDNDALSVRTCELSGIPAVTSLPSTDEHGYLVALTPTFLCHVATREGAPRTLIGA